MPPSLSVPLPVHWTNLVVLEDRGGSALGRNAQPDVGEGGLVVAQSQAHLHRDRLTGGPCRGQDGQGGTVSDNLHGNTLC